jgi:hypothetical protein
MCSSPDAAVKVQTGFAEVPSPVAHADAVESTKMTSLVAAQCPSVIHTPGPPQSESAAHARQVSAVVLQTGVVPEQSVFPTQPTQAFIAVLQAGVGALQSVEPTH